MVLDNVSFRFGDTDPLILNGINLTVRPGEFVALPGPSGAGRSTLLRIILGLASPSRGEMRVDRMPLPDFRVPRRRARLGVVLQDDTLPSGTLADSIAFFDPIIDMVGALHCAQSVAIHDGIAQMPMGYLSLVGDMGAALSNRQRPLLARALYRKPQILILDEGTAKLDEASEDAIASRIRTMELTRTVVAHRPALIERAGRVLSLRNGCLHGVSGSPQNINALTDTGAWSLQ